MMALIANHLWQSTIVAALTALLAVALRRNRAQVRYALWLTASVKFLVPFAALVAIGRLLDWRPATPVAASEVTAAIEAVSQPFTQMVILATAAAPAAGAALVVTLPLVLFAVWVAGVIAVLAAWGAESWRVAALVRAASPLDDPRVLDTLRRLDAAPLRVVSADTLLEPGVFGIVRPVLVWPRALSDHLSDEQIAAILEHELCHVRRRDNLAAAVHRAVQAVFWFHPLVWWLGARLVEERERACDEAVLALGSEPHTYAESILTTCRLQLEAPACVAGITGPQVKARIERIMTGDTVAALTTWRKLMLAATATSAIAAPLVAGVLSAPSVAAQAQAPSAGRALPSFEVASIKPNPSGGGDILMQVLPGGRANIANVPLRVLIRQAYRLQDFQIVGGPGWINSDRFNITARAEGNPSGTQMQDMLRALLIDRFRLVVHEERRELPIYALVMAGSDRKPGVQLHQAKPCFRSPVNLPPQNLPLGETPCGFRLRPGMIAARGVSMAALAGALANQVSRVVVDRTGLPGDFDLEIEFTPFQRPATLDAAAPSDRPVDAGPSIFTALQEQLGLKLDSDRGPVDVLLIDRVEPPTPD